MTDTFSAIARQIEEIEKQLGNLLRDAQADDVLPVRWSFCAGVLCWHVQLVEEVLEPDIDIEITSVALIIRARSAREPSKCYWEFCRFQESLIITTLRFNSNPIF